MGKLFVALQSSKPDHYSKNTTKSTDKNLKLMLAILISLDFKDLCNLSPYEALQTMKNAKNYKPSVCEFCKIL